jgi:hypothetical protein
LIRGEKNKNRNFIVTIFKNCIPNRSRAAIAKSAQNYLTKFQNGELTDWTYNLMEFNCQHFVTLCAFGTEFSEQVDTTRDKPIIQKIGEGLGKSSHSSYEE